MKPISIVFSKASSFSLFSNAIMFGLKTPFSHVAIKMIDGDTGQVVYYQASNIAVNCVSEAEFLAKEIIIFQKDVQASDKVFKTGKSFAINQLGKPYDISAIFVFALQIILGMVGINIKNPDKADGNEYVCSQFAAAYISVCENIKIDVTNMTPKALYEIMPTLPDVWN